LLQGVVAVLSGGTVDVLCHAAVRARNAGVMLAACRLATGPEGFRELEGQLVTVEAVSRTLPQLITGVCTTRPASGSLAADARNPACKAAYGAAAAQRTCVVHNMDGTTRCRQH
jgi:hypothetical protein